MAQKDANVKFKADASDFTEAISAAGRRVKELQSALKLNATQMDVMGQSADALTQRQNLLAQQAQALSDKKTALVEKLRLAEQYFDADSAVVTRLRTQINNLEIDSVKLEREMSAVTVALDQQRDMAERTETATERLSGEISRQKAELSDLKQQYMDAVLSYGETSDEAQRLAGEITRLSSELSINRTSMESAQSSADALCRAVETVTEAEGRNETATERLSGEISRQKAELSDLKQQYMDAVLRYGETSNEAQELAGKITRLSRELYNNRKNMEGATTVANDLYKAVEATAKAEEANKTATGKLTSEISRQETELSDLKQQYTDAVLRYGETSNEAQELAGKITRLSRELYNNRKNMEGATTAANDLYKAVEATAKAEEANKTATGKLTSEISKQETELSDLKRRYMDSVLQYGKTSKEAKGLAHEITNLSAELYANNKKMKSAQTAADDLCRGFQDTEQEASSLADVIQGNLIADGFQQLGSVLSDVAESTKEYRTIMSALDVSSERAGYSAQETAETYRDLYGVLDDTQAAATTTANLQAMKLAQSDLNEVLDGVIGSWATYGDSIQVDGLAESINETMRCGAVTGAFADVLNWGSQEGERFGVTLRSATDANEDWNNSVEDASSAEDYFNLALEECQTQAERANLIMSVFADQGLTDAGNMWQENNQALLEANQATADQQEILARLGETATPILTAVKNGFNEVLSAVADVTDNLNTQQISQSVEGGFDFLLAHGQTISAIIVGIGAAFASWKVITTVTSVVSKIGSLSKLIAMLSNPVGIAAAAIGALVAAFILLYNNVEPFREVVNQTFSKLVDLFQQARTAAGAFGANVMDALAPLADLASSLWEHMTPLVTLIKENLGQAFNSLSESVQRIRDTLTNTLLPALSTLQPVFWVIAGVLGGVFVEAVGIAVGVVNGIISAIGGLADAVAGVVEIFSNVFELLAGIVTLDGDRCIQAVQGIGQGILDVFGGLWNGVSGFLQGFVDGVVGFFQGLWDTLVGHSIVPDTINGIINCFAGLWGGVRGFVSGFANNVINTWNGIKNTVSTVAGAIQNTVSQKWNAVKSTTSSAFHTVKSTASTGWNSVRSTVVSATENVRSNVQSKWNAVKSVTSAAFGAVKNSAVTSWNSVRSTVASATENVRSNVQSKWNTVKSVTSTAFVAMKNSTVTAWSGIKSTISSAASSVYSTVSSKFNGIRSTISTVMSRARSTVSSAIAAIRSKFHFSWSLPKLKLPHLSVTGGFSLTPPSVPKFSIKWYRDGGILQAPTLFGAMGNHLLGGGEAGPEAVAPIDLLQDYVQAAVERTIGSSMTQLTAAIDALASRPIYLQVDGHTIAVATAGDMDDALGTRQVLTARGLCL